MIENRDLTLEERYKFWFVNNFQTGMEYYFDPQNLPDFDNPYWAPTPKKIITTHDENGKKITTYEY